MLDLHTLNPQQRQAVETIHGPVLILAGAGTGKTRVITFRIAHLIRSGVKPGNILAVTFTNKAAREMKERVAALLPRRPRGEDGKKPDGPTISTFHSLCARILRQHIERLGYKRNFVIYDESEQISAIKKVLSHVKIHNDKLDPRGVLAHLSRFKNTSSSQGRWVDQEEAIIARHIRDRYESALRACNAIDFDDLLLLTRRLFHEHSEVLAACQAKYQYVMVDEYQDTNAIQFELIRLLTCEHRNLCVVGDDDQSIYGWRGAEIANLLDLEKHYRDVKVVKLEQNYRSTNVILSAANAVIQHNRQRRGKKLWSNKGHGEKIVLHTFTSDEEEARSVVEQIEFTRLTRRIPWGAQAILFRTNQQSRAFEMALRQAKVRYHLIGGQSFFDRREVRDLLAYWKMFLNPHDDVSLLRIANVPPRGLSDTTMERLLGASQERHCSVFTAMRHTDVQAGLQPRTRESLRGFLHFVDHTRNLLESDPKLSLRLWTDRFIEEIGYFQELRRSEKNQETADNRIRNLKDLIAGIDGDSQPGTRPAFERLEEFLEEIALDTEREEEDEPRQDAVTLITMHSCKGLEFPHVYIAGLEQGLLPHARSQEENTVDEERRLFYVAMTRAQESLSIGYCLTRKKYGQLSPCHPSEFLKELPPDLVEDADKKGKAPVAVNSGKSLFSAMRDVVGE